MLRCIWNLDDTLIPRNWALSATFLPITTPLAVEVENLARELTHVRQGFVVRDVECSVLMDPCV